MKFNENTTLIQYIKEQGLLPKKSFGQNFLADEGVYQSIIDAADLQANDHVIEVGPGLGTLTKLLAEKAQKVIAIEKDSSLVPHIQRHTTGLNNIEIIERDVLDVDLHTMDLQSYKVIANIPYYITSPIIFKFLKHAKRPERLVLLMQKEVAQKIATIGKGGTFLSISVQAYGKPEIIRDVAAECFYPAPKVTSSILRITPYDTPRIQSPTKDFEKIVKMGFSNKRKKLTHGLHAGFRISKELSRHILESCGIDTDTRPEMLTVEEWDRLTIKCAPLLADLRNPLKDEDH